MFRSYSYLQAEIHTILILGVCILLRVSDPGDGGFLFSLRNVTIVG
jgi:hypothetical protein